MSVKHFVLPLFIAISLAATLTACDTSKAPSSYYEYALQGAYAGDLSPSGDYAFVGSIHHGGSLWDAQANDRLFNWNHKKGEFTGILEAGFSPDNAFVATSDPHTIILWEVATGKALTFWSSPGKVLDIALTEQGNSAILGLDDHTAVLFDIKNGGIKREYRHDAPVFSVAVNQEHDLLLTGSGDFTAKLWRLSTGKLLHTREHFTQVKNTALSHDGTLALSASQSDKVHIWSTETGKIEKTIRSKGMTYSAVQFSEDDSQLLTGTTTRLVQLWNLKNYQEKDRWHVEKKKPFKPTSATVLALAFNKKPGTYSALASNGLINQFK